jgi:NADH:ubiquinone oxidoreductase subunit 6 (subunit J)
MSDEQRTHEQNVARLLELEQAREARRQQRRRALPWVVAVLVLAAVIVPVVIHQQNEAQRERCAESQMYWDMLGEPENAPDC